MPNCNEIVVGSARPTRRHELGFALAFGAVWLVTAAWGAANGGFDDALGRRQGAATLFRDVRVFDGQETVATTNVLIRDGTIAAIGPTVSPGDVEVVDGRGKTLLPGLIDAHVHFRPDGLREAMVFGVTTELDMFTLPKLIGAAKEELTTSRGTELADLRSAGTLVTAPGGHGTQYGFTIPTITGPEHADAFVEARLAEGSDYIKLVYDDGSAWGRPVPTISVETMTAVIEAAHRHGRLAVAHIATLQGAREALNAGADGLAHLFIDRLPDPEFGKFVLAKHAFVIPTLTVLESATGTPSGASLVADPLLRPYITPASADDLESAFTPAPNNLIHYEAAVAAVRQLKAYEVPILAGTDAPNPGTAHGASMHRELELLVRAGLTPAEALTAATAAPAAAFHLDDRGRIKVGLRADFVLVNGDPTADVMATRDIVAIWKGGVRFARERYRQHPPP